MAKDMERYRKLTAADVQRAAKQYLAGSHRVVAERRAEGRHQTRRDPGVTP